MQQDWQLDVESLLSLFPALKLAGIGMEVSVDFVKDELKKDAKSALQTIMDAYLTLVTGPQSAQGGRAAAGDNHRRGESSHGMGG